MEYIEVDNSLKYHILTEEIHFETTTPPSSLIIDNY